MSRIGELMDLLKIYQHIEYILFDLKDKDYSLEQYKASKQQTQSKHNHHDIIHNMLNFIHIFCKVENILYIERIILRLRIHLCIYCICLNFANTSHNEPNKVNKNPPHLLQIQVHILCIYGNKPRNLHNLDLNMESSWVQLKEKYPKHILNMWHNCHNNLYN